MISIFDIGKKRKMRGYKRFMAQAIVIISALGPGYKTEYMLLFEECPLDLAVFSPPASLIHCTIFYC